MADRERILEYLSRYLLAYGSSLNVIPIETWALKDALELLKAPEPVKPEKLTVMDFGSMESGLYLCGACRMPIERGDVYCKHCGKKVKRDA